MMKKILFLFALSLMVVTSFAQSMSDDKVIEFIMQEQENGASQQEIAAELVKKGVTMEQLQRIKKKAEREKNGFAVADEADEPVLNRNRGRNDEKKKNDEKNDEKKDENKFLIDENIEEELADILVEEEDKSEEVFGRNIFNNELLTFEPSMNIPTPSTYILGAGDDVIIDVWGTSQLNIKETISPDGKIFIDGVGPLKLSGLTVTQAEASIREKLEGVYGGSHISVSLGSVRSIQVQVVGEVVTPGTYTVSALSTAFNALYAAGGINDMGTLRDIKVYRKGKNIATIDVYEYLLHGNVSGDVRMQDNDVITVGAYCNIVEIAGKAKRPMKYEMKEGETLLDVISYAGGFAAEAYTENFNVTRKSGREYTMHTVSKPEAAMFVMKDGDLVQVGEMIQRFSNMIEIAGAVFFPGQYELGVKISTIGELVAAAGGVMEEAFLSRAVLQHRNHDKTMETVAIDLKGIIDGSSPDVSLKNNDLLFIPSSTEMQGDQIVTIEGEVNLPGKYKYAKNTTIEDLILQAGGLTRAASTMKIDVFRNILDHNSTEFSFETSESFSFSLKDGFVVDGGDNFTLEPFDVVVVRRTPSYSKMQVVKVTGCVNYEGGYVLANKNYRLSDLVNDAGGFTKLAYIKGASLYRKMTEEERRQREITMKTSHIQLLEERMRDDDKELNTEILDSLLQLKLNLGNVYPVAIDLAEAIKKPGSVADIVLREGDVLNIPTQSSTIRVSGEVRYPITLSFEKGKNVKHYIKHAGGYTESARKKGVYIVYMNGNVVKASKSSKKIVEPGCEIVVPRKKMSGRMSVAEMATIGTSTASIATMIVAIINLLK